MRTQRNEKLYAQVFRKMRAYIIEHKLQPGDLLPTEQAMCEMLGVSRNVLREAIKSMELMGLVSALPGRGTALQAFNLDFIFQNVIFANVGEQMTAISEMLEIRKRLELGFMRTAFETLEEKDIQNIRNILEKLKKSWEKHRFFHAEDKAFHMALFAKIENQTLLSLMDAIWDVDENFKTEEKFKHLDETIVKHENIVKALESGNEEAFYAAMIAHFASGKYLKTNSFAEY